MNYIHTVIRFLSLRSLRLKYLFAVIALFIISYSAAQEYKTSLKMIGRPLQDSIMLRWAPDNFDGWNAGNKYGYSIVRYTIIKDGEMVTKPVPEVLTPQPLKPWTGDKWEKIMDTDDYAGVAAQAIFGETFEIANTRSTNVFDIVNKVKEQDSRFAFALFAADMSPITARASGLWYTDKNVKKGEKYLYRVMLMAPPSLVISDTGFVYTGVDEYMPLPKPLAVQGEFGDKGVILHWERKLFENLFISYSVERSEDGIHFEKINKQPVVYTQSADFDETRELLYIDSLAINNKNYHYKIYGHTSFGERSPASDVITGKGVAAIKVIPEIKNDYESNGQIVLDWTYPKEEEPNIKGFKVLRATQYRTAYDTVSALLPANTREFIDIKPLSVNYYKIEACGWDGKNKSSVPSMVQLVDSIPPLPPTGLKATIDTTGKVLLSWKPNTEKDIYGYRIFRANEANDEYSQITIAPIEDTIFVDSVNIKTLTPKVYYQLTAIDKRQNHSGFSTPLEIERPDMIPPAPPVIKSIKSGTNGICIEWIASNSKDVIKHQIVRKEKGATNLTTKEIPVSDTSRIYTDSLAVVNTVYYYTLVAIDKTGYHSDPSIELAGQKIPSTAKGRLEGIKWKTDRKNMAVTITWKAPAEKVERYIIYRKSGESGTLTVYARISGSIPEFTDKQMKADTKFTYLIRAYMKNGNVSNSEEVNILF
jgi:fibronectin type 3 domain-containing protein